MTTRSVLRTVALYLLALHLAGCAAEVADPQSDEEVAEVETIGQALGGFYKLWDGGFYETTALAIGDNYTVFKEHFMFGDFVDVAFTSTGVLIEVPELPSNRATVTAAASNIQYTFVADSAGNTIYARENRIGQPWEVVATTGGNVNAMFLDGTTVYWSEPTGIYNAQRAIHGASLVRDDMSLLGLEGKSLYVEALRNGSWVLGLIDLNNSTYRMIGTNGTPFDAGFSYDANYFYWTENSYSSTNRVRRMNKTDGSVANVKSATNVFYRTPVSNGSALYWIEEPIAGGALTIRRKNLSNGNFVSTPFPFPSLSQMRILNGTLVLTPRVATDPVREALYQGQL